MSAIIMKPINGCRIHLCRGSYAFFRYMLIYYKYMYSLFLAIGPLVVLVVLNLCIIGASVFSNTESESNSGDTIALVNVYAVFFFFFDLSLQHSVAKRIVLSLSRPLHHLPQHGLLSPPNTQQNPAWILPQFCSHKLRFPNTMLQYHAAHLSPIFSQWKGSKL